MDRGKQMMVDKVGTVLEWRRAMAIALRGYAIK